MGIVRTLEVVAFHPLLRKAADFVKRLSVRNPLPKERLSCMKSMDHWRST